MAYSRSVFNGAGLPRQLSCLGLAALLWGCGPQAQTCVEGELRCTGSALQMCSPEGEYLTYQVCANGCDLTAAAPACEGPAAEAAYVGAQSCQWCHEGNSVFETYPLTGHARALTPVLGGVAPAMSQLTPPSGYAWSDISYVVGGAAHQALFVDNEGLVITGDEANPDVQLVLDDGSWAPYHTGERERFDCGACHGTGYDAQASKQAGLPGAVGSWALDGVGCEACHGAGGTHAVTADTSAITVDPSDAACGQCHARTGGHGVQAEDGFIKSKAQYDELLASPHAGVVGCVDCHDPHVSMHGPEGHEAGLVATCTSCHADVKVNLRMGDLTCQDCHMPKVVKAATAEGPYRADRRTHLVGIDVGGETPFLSEDGTLATGKITLDYACLSCHADKDRAWAAQTAALIHAPEPAGDTFVGDQTCAACHADKPALTATSGHAHILNAVEGGQAPSWPYTAVSEPPPGLAWTDISYVVGGYSSKAVFVDSTGHLVTGEQAQYNLADGSWAPYHPGEALGYSCGQCHSTGYDPSGVPPAGLEGIVGSWAAPNVGCEACHGAGGTHVLTTLATDIIRETSAASCGACHTNQDPQDRIVEEGGFIRHEGQYQEWLASPHAGGAEQVGCVDCHSPHLSSTHADQPGATPPGQLATCSSCHQAQAAYQKSERMALWNTCEDCHMPLATRSAKGDPTTYEADVRTHIVDINPAQTEQFSGGFSNPYLGLDFACKSCHRIGGIALVYSDDELRAMAEGYHDAL